MEERGELTGPPPDELTAFRQHGADQPAVIARAAALESRCLWLGRWIGALFGVGLALKLARVFFPPASDDYETDGTRCVSCARCFSTCPYELIRRGIPVQVPPKGGPGG